MSAGERLARATVSLAVEPGDVRALGVVAQMGPVDFVAALKEEPDRPTLRDAAQRMLVVEPAQVLERAARTGIRFVVPGDAEWPPGLDALAGAGQVNERGAVPVGLWVKGPLGLDRLAGSVAIVGSRSATSYGTGVASDIAAGLGYAGVPVVSGGAFGIDYAAHRGALSADGPTAAVLACGVDRVYPQAHRALLQHLGEEHVLVSESPPGAAPHRIRFLARNRLIAALARGTVVVEAAVRSGALSTVGWAQRLGRVVMGVPGPVTSATSEGVHHQIRTGGAVLVTSAAEVLEMVGAAGEHLVADPRGPDTARDRLTVKEQQVLDACPVGAVRTTESIAFVAALEVAAVRGILDRLVTAGLVEPGPGGWRLAPSALA